jgi:Xaa-Pro aminopeptidase
LHPLSGTIRYDVNDVFWIEDFDAKLESLYPTTVYTFSGVSVSIPESATHDTTTLRGSLAAARVIKTNGEIELLRAAAELSVDAHKTIMSHVRCGNYESEAESLFRYVCHNYGARFQAYVPIMGSGRVVGFADWVVLEDGVGSHDVV